jgi:hypothetical protein
MLACVVLCVRVGACELFRCRFERVVMDGWNKHPPPGARVPFRAPGGAGAHPK